MQPINIWQFNTDLTADILVRNINIISGTVLALLFLIFYVRERDALSEKFLNFALLLGGFSLLISSIVLSVLQYYSFKTSLFVYALPPYKPLTEYFLGYVFFNFWITWIAGLIVTGIVSIYWWIVKKQSGGMRISSKEILIFMLFGALVGWPAVMVYVFFVFVMYVGVLLALNLARLDSERRIPILKLLHRFIKDDEIRTPIMPYFIIAAPLAFLFSPAIFALLNLTGLYIVPRLFFE